jgi:branched-subunit amino acid transport protein
MSELTYYLMIAGMLLVTYLPRLLPAWLLQARTIPPFLSAWLKYVPVAVLSALLLPSLLVVDGKIDLAWDNLYILAAVPAALAALRTRSMFVTVIVGMGVVALIRLLTG